MSDLRTAFILFDNEQLDFEKFKSNLKNEWGIEIKEKVQEDILIFYIKEMMIAVTFVNGRVPNNEAEENSKNNYLWKEGFEVTKKHKSHAILNILQGDDPVKVSMTFSVIATSLLRLDNAIGIYQIPTVLSPEFYIENTIESIQNNELPILNWVYIGIYPDKNGFSGYTMGLDFFNKKEIEVLNSKAKPSELYEFLLDISSYVIESDVELLDGQTIGFSEEQKLPITESEGKALDGSTVKIEF